VSKGQQHSNSSLSDHVTTPHSVASLPSIPSASLQQEDRINAPRRRPRDNTDRLKEIQERAAMASASSTTSITTSEDEKGSATDGGNSVQKVHLDGNTSKKSGSRRSGALNGNLSPHKQERKTRSGGFGSLKEDDSSKKSADKTSTSSDKSKESEDSE